MQRPNLLAAGMPEVPLAWDEWLCEVEHLWQNQAKDEVIHKLAEAFRSVEPRHLHGFVLHLLDKSHDLRRMKPSSLGLVVLTEFTQWVQRNRHLFPKDLSGILTDDMKLMALRLATSGHINLFDMLCQLYRLRSEGNEFMAAHLRVLLARKQFKEAGVCAYKLQLQHCFRIEEICLPLVFQDKVNLVEKYIQGCETAQLELVQRLDSFCARGFDRSQLIYEMNIPGLKPDKLRPRNLSKLVLRLVKLFQLDPAVCPNTIFHKDLGAVKYLLYKKYIEQSLEAANWDELVCNTIKDNKPLQEEFINQLMDYNDLPAAAKWALHFGIDRAKLAADVLGEIDKHQACPPPSDEAENWDDDVALPHQVPFYQLKLPLERVVMVDTPGLLERCETHIVQMDQVVGIDMEWTPSFTATQTTRVAVVQLATMDWVYLLDMLALMSSKADRTAAFFQRFLSSAKVLKLGFGIRGDFQMLSKSYPSLKGPITDVQRMVDLHTLSKQIVKAKPDVLKGAGSMETHPRRPAAKGLSELTLMCFGQSLDKKEQLSDWEKRPLRSSQAQYAALDAFCLLEIYAFLKVRVRDARLEVDMELTYSSKTPPKAKSKAKTKESKRPKNKGRPDIIKTRLPASDRCLRPGDLSVVCDTMLQGLGRQLRVCGVDVKILDTADDHDEAAKIAFREGRVILTAGTPYHTLKSQVGEGRCMAIDTTSNARQQVVKVLEHFNVRVRQGDIFSRCQVCNTSVYVHVNREDMKRLWLQKRSMLEAEGSVAETPALSANCRMSSVPASHSAVTSAERSATSKPAESEPATASTSGSTPANYLTRPIHDFDSDDEGTGLCLDFEDGSEVGARDYYNIARPTAPSPTIAPAVSTNPSRLSVPNAPIQEGTNAAASQASSKMLQTMDPWDSELQPYLNTPRNEAEVAPANDSRRHRTPGYYHPPTDGQLERSIDFDQVSVGGKVALQVDLIPEGILEKVESFFCCAGCGKAFWEGTHFDRVVAKFAHVLDFSREPNV